jgi:hypothetical protein
MENQVMIKRLTPLVLATLCALPVAPQAQSSTGASTPKGDALVCVADTRGLDVTALTAADREAFQLAQLSSDPQLGQLRGGHLGLVIVLLLIILIIVLVD